MLNDDPCCRRATEAVQRKSHPQASCTRQPRRHLNLRKSCIFVGPVHKIVFLSPEYWCTEALSKNVWDRMPGRLGPRASALCAAAWWIWAEGYVRQPALGPGGGGSTPACGLPPPPFCQSCLGSKNACWEAGSCPGNPEGIRQGPFPGWGSGKNPALRVT